MVTKGSWTLLARLYKDAGTPSNECSLSEFWQAVKLLSMTTCYLYLIIQIDRVLSWADLYRIWNRFLQAFDSPLKVHRLIVASVSHYKGKRKTDISLWCLFTMEERCLFTWFKGPAEGKKFGLAKGTIDHTLSQIQVGPRYILRMTKGENTYYVILVGCPIYAKHCTRCITRAFQSTLLKRSWNDSFWYIILDSVAAFLTK